MSYTETEIEQEIQDKGLDAPRLTPDDIDPAHPQQSSLQRNSAKKTGQSGH